MQSYYNRNCFLTCQKLLISNNLSLSLRPRRAQSDLTFSSLPKLEEDPCMMTSLAEKLFPQLSLENKQTTGANTSLSCVAVKDGDKSVQLPSLNVEQNYSQMLSEIVAHFWDFRGKWTVIEGNILLLAVTDRLTGQPIVWPKGGLASQFTENLVPVLSDHVWGAI